MKVSVLDPFDAVNDSTLPSLRLALDPIGAKRQLKRIMRPQLTEGDRFQLRAIRVVRHKPAKRCLIEYDLRLTRPDGYAEKVTWIGKVRARRFGGADFRLHRAIWDAGWNTKSSDGFSVPRPIGVAPDLRLWLQRKVDGQSATELLAGPGGEALARRIAEAAHKLHRTPVHTGRSHTLDDELRILRECLDVVLEREPGWQARIERLWLACLRLASDTTESVPTCIHRDFYADQVIVRKQRLYLLDFDLCCIGDPALDIGNFIGHITELSLRTLGDPAGLACVEQAIEDRFIELAGEAIRAAVRTYTALTLLRHVYLSTRFPDRRHLTELLLELCEQRLGLVSDQPVMLAGEVLVR
jgi:hypothetical protein